MPTVTRYVVYDDNMRVEFQDEQEAMDYASDNNCAAPSEELVSYGEPIDDNDPIE